MSRQGRGVSLLEARNVSKAFGGLTVLGDVSFDIAAGDFVLLRGANGSGKTTLLNIVSGLLTPDEGTISLLGNGRRPVRFEFRSRKHRRDGFSLTALSRNGVIRSWQDVRLFSTLSLLDNLNVAVRPQLGEHPCAALCQARSVRSQEEQLRGDSFQLLDSFGLARLASVDAQKRTDDASAPSGTDRVATGSTISLGQAKRAAIARACRAGASLLLLDEPLSGLDGPGIQSVVHLLQTINREQGVAIVIVEHESCVEHLTDLAHVVWRLEAGSLRPSGSSGEETLRPGFLDRWVASITRSNESHETHELPMGARLTIIRRHEPLGDSAPALRVSDVCVLRGGRSVLPPISLSLPPGCVGIIEAPNGWGKTSLAEAVAGLLPIAGGEIILNGVGIEKYPPWKRRQHGLSLLQSRSVSFPKLRVEEALTLSGVATPPVTLRTLLHRTVASLSGGERQRLLITCAHADGEGCVYLWDEPFLSLDEDGLGMLTSAVRKRNSREAFLILVPSTKSQAGG